jgi:hypothetical protein
MIFFVERLRSPNPTRNSVIEKDEGISDEEDTTELKLQLELNERVCKIISIHTQILN